MRLSGQIEMRFPGQIHAITQLIGLTYLGSAQAAALDNNFKLSQSHFEKAIAILKACHLAEDAELQIALENYASLLNKNNMHAEAQKVCDDFRKLKSKSMAPFEK